MLLQLRGDGRAVVLCKHVGLAEDEVVLALHLDLGTAVLGEDDLVADLDVEGDQIPVLVPALTHGENTGEIIPLDIAVGDTVVYSKYGGTEYTLAGEDVLILTSRDVLAKVKK